MAASRRPSPAAFHCQEARSAFPPRPRGLTAPRRSRPTGWKGLFLGAALLAAPLLHGTPAEASPRSACLDAVRAAEAKYDLPDGLLVALALAESGLHAHAISVGGRAFYPDSRAEARTLLARSSARGSVMAGCVQVNTKVHASNGSDWPLDPRRAADWAARYLRQHYDSSGNWAAAIRRWNGAGPKDNKLVCRVQAKLQVTSPNSTALGRPNCGGSHMARMRRDGQALLELAEAPE
ncbi:lytic transglycosylase domain-containing protein [Pseudoroseomonas oryzae]|uniref:Lytic transglycosylase domain-containing protein n=2 Tax=Teichococcus oryzae TaxID=1608942 RepID=A0A5B2TKQ4_9PROT|nr:lytic transglycosylase domain-containing protein [Pseudoroseomonas oryzae]